MSDDEAFEIEELIAEGWDEQRINKILEGFRSKGRPSRRFPIDRMNSAYEYSAVNSHGDVGGAGFMINGYKAALCKRQYNEEAGFSLEKRRTRQNPNHNALDD